MTPLVCSVLQCRFPGQTEVFMGLPLRPLCFKSATQATQDLIRLSSELLTPESEA